jgi:hypothetical protein
MRPRRGSGGIRVLMPAVVLGGLLSYPMRSPGPELERNGGFEAGIEGWRARGFEVDDKVAHSGKRSLRLTDAQLIRYSQSAQQRIPGGSRAGFYSLSAWIRMENLGANGKGKGVRIGVKAVEGRGEPRCSRGCGFSEVRAGTSGWRELRIDGVYLNDPSLGLIVAVDAYSEPSGTFWVDDVVVREEVQPPLDVVLRVPNYRGILWADEPQVAEFDLARYAEGQVTAEVSADSGASRTFDVQPGRVRLDLTGLGGASLEVTFRLAGRPAFPPFRLVRRPATDREQMTLTFTPDGRFLVRGKPTFLLGVYDSGLGYSDWEQGWERGFSSRRRLFELPGLNGYINYWFGGAPTRAMQTMMNVLQRHGILYWQTANCSGRARYGNRKGFPGTGADPSYAETLGRHPGLGGWYLADECVAGLADDVFADNRLLQERDPDGVNLGVFTSPQVGPWLASVDVLGVDVYPIRGSEPSGGYALGRVYDDAVAIRQAAGENRPFWQVIQFYKSTSRGRWPTKEELRSMSYAAIVGGANGLFYWSLGSNALAYVCRGWCPEKVEYFERLKSVFAELSAFSALANRDLPASSVAVSDPNIKIRVKTGGGAIRLYVIAYNHSALPRRATITVSDNGPSLAASFVPWGVQVLEVR